MRRWPTRVVGWTAALLAIALFCGLGAWQLDRGRQKQAMLDAAAHTLSARRALPLDAAADAASSGTHAWAEGAGRFADLPAVLLDNQQRNGRPGLRAYRVFLPEQGRAPLLVELGWLPVPPDRTIPAIAPAPAWTRLRGLLSPPPSAGLVAPAVQPQADGSLLVLALDPEALARALGLQALAPRVLRADPELPGGYARDLQVLANTLPPERHLGYAVQWFGLAATVLVTALILTFRRSRR
ncbi:SURF1 family protein [Luteimonas huabeiensis]|uniref:SURF1 family protein n=1 Tax=Luteimonas huabeiensis TaxID=1244513 RepID=UPI000467027E|nr:SURF1 family protein [Luteimonas huabeiensis]